MESIYIGVFTHKAATRHNYPELGGKLVTYQVNPTNARFAMNVQHNGKFIDAKVELAADGIVKVEV